MPDLDCSVRTCYYNKKNNCCLSSIEVEGSEANTSESTSCGSFRNKMEGSFKNSVTDNEPRSYLEIKCKASKCTFNSSNKCYASHIGIAGDGAGGTHQTECAGFYRE